MALTMESCSIREVCVSLGGSEKLLHELRDGLQDWLKLQPHLPQDVPKETLEHLILGTKMSLEQAKRKLDMFYTMRRLVPEIFADRDPRGASLTRLHSMMQIVYLPELTPEKYRVCIMRMQPCSGDDYTKLDGLECFKYAGMIEEILMTESRSLGNIYVFDHSLVTLGLIAKYTPTVLKKAVVAMTEAHAIRIKGFHFVNAAPVTEAVVGFMKKMLKPKLAARVHAYSRGDYESLCQYVPKSMLPKDYGGEGSSITHLAELWHKKVDEKRDWFLEQENILVDEGLRPGPAIDDDNLFGFSGSFRKLDVD